MQGFEEAAVLVPDSSGLGYTSEKRIEHVPPPSSTNPFDSTSDLAAIRAEKRRREIEAMSTAGTRREIQDTFASDAAAAGDLDAAAERARNGTVPGARISLREQLRLNKEASEAAWAEKNNPFRPPPGLSEEDYQMYAQLEESRLSKHAAQREQEADDYRQFAQAMQSKQATTSGNIVEKVELKEIDAIDPTLSFSHLTPASASASLLTASSTLSNDASSSVAPSTVPPVLILKRKHSSTDPDKPKKEKKHKKQKKEKDESASTATTKSSSLVAPSSNPSSAAAPSTSTNSLAGLLAYSSEDDE